MQKRSANTYQKINALFKRDVNNIIMPYSRWVKPEFEYLKNNLWRCEEKIDGTCIRLEITSTITYNENDSHQCTGVFFNVEYKGKTDNASIPSLLINTLKSKFPEETILNAVGLKSFIPAEEFVNYKWVDEENIPRVIDIYGEGYGYKIQSCGSKYLHDSNDFIVFDVKVNDLYLTTESRDSIAQKLGAKTTPFIGFMTIPEAIDYVKKGFKSLISESDLAAEGLVLRTEAGLCTRLGERLIVKIKTCDFDKYYAMYKTYDKVEQQENKLYNHVEKV